MKLCLFPCWYQLGVLQSASAKFCHLERVDVQMLLLLPSGAATAGRNMVKISFFFFFPQLLARWQGLLTQVLIWLLGWVDLGAQWAVSALVSPLWSCCFLEAASISLCCDSTRGLLVQALPAVVCSKAIKLNIESLKKEAGSKHCKTIWSGNVFKKKSWTTEKGISWSGGWFTYWYCCLLVKWSKWMCFPLRIAERLIHNFLWKQMFKWYSECT